MRIERAHVRPIEGAAFGWLKLSATRAMRSPIHAAVLRRISAAVRAHRRGQRNRDRAAQHSWMLRSGMLKS